MTAPQQQQEHGAVMNDSIMKNNEMSSRHRNGGIVLHHHHHHHHHHDAHRSGSALWRKTKRVQKVISIVRSNQRKNKKKISSEEYVCTIEPGTSEHLEWQVSVARKAQQRPTNGGNLWTQESKRDMYAMRTPVEREGLPMSSPAWQTRKRVISGSDERSKRHSSVFESNGDFSVERQTLLQLGKCPLTGSLKFTVPSKDWKRRSSSLGGFRSSASFNGTSTSTTLVKLDSHKELWQNPELEQEAAALLSLLSTDAVVQELERMEREFGEEDSYDDEDDDDDDDCIAFEVSHLHCAEEKLEHELDALTLQDIDSFVVAPRATQESDRRQVSTDGQATMEQEEEEEETTLPSVLKFDVTRRQTLPPQKDVRTPGDRMGVEGRHPSPLVEENGNESRQNNDPLGVSDIVSRSRAILHQTFSSNNKNNKVHRGTSPLRQERSRGSGWHDGVFLDEDDTSSKRRKGVHVSCSTLLQRIGGLFFMCAGTLFPKRAHENVL